jgi:hypothetical protein
VYVISSIKDDMPIPLLSSNPNAPISIYLDFAGSPTDHNTPAYTNTADIPQIFSRVAEKFSPFNINITTVETPAEYGKVQWILIGGNSSWTGQGIGGQAQRGAIFDVTPAYVFPENLGYNPMIVSEAIAHETGHTLGLQHHSVYDANGTFVSAYDHGNALIAPIMGTSYYSQRGLWENGPTDTSATVFQDDLAILSGGYVNPGYRPQDHPQTFSNAETLTGSAVGVIETASDQDTFKFHFNGGVVSATLTVADYGPMLHGRFVLYDTTGTLLASAANPDTLGQTLISTQAPGDYYLVAKSFGGYGDLGQYTVSLVPEPELLVSFWIWVMAFLIVPRKRRRPSARQ